MRREPYREEPSKVVDTGRFELRLKLLDRLEEDEGGVLEKGTALQYVIIGIPIIAQIAAASSKFIH